jgi:hypothetical protein
MEHQAAQSLGRPPGKAEMTELQQLRRDSTLIQEATISCGNADQTCRMTNSASDPG